MRFKIDENLHEEVVTLLINAGHDTESVHSEGLRGSADTALAEHCRKEQRAFVTLDLDFADIRQFPPAANPGIIVLRLGIQSRSHVLRVIEGLLELFKHETIAAKLWVVSETDVRIRD